jgi:Fe-S-cluster containining protein
MTEWWNDGLPFDCTVCGKCCHARGDVAYVYVNYRERKALADHIGLGLAAFNRGYTRSDEDGHRTLRFRDGRCIFLDGPTCTVHEAKPTQCRTWPFWEELLETPEAYRAAVLDFCAGSRVDGPLVDAASIRAQMEATEKAQREG